MSQESIFYKGGVFDLTDQGTPSNPPTNVARMFYRASDDTFHVIDSNGASLLTGGGGSGTVSSGTTGQLAVYASTGTTVSGSNTLPSSLTFANTTTISPKSGSTIILTGSTNTQVKLQCTDGVNTGSIVVNLGSVQLTASAGASNPIDLNDNGNTVTIGSFIGSYNGISGAASALPSGTTGNAVSYAVAISNLTVQAAAIAATTVFATPATIGAGTLLGSGLYRVSYSATVTRVATSSSTLGGANGFQVKYTNVNDSVVKTSPAGQTSAGNTTGTCVSGSILVFAAASTNIQYTFGYTSSGVTAMQYDLNVLVEFIG